MGLNEKFEEIMNKRILRIINEETDIYYLNTFAEVLEVGGNTDETERNNYCNYIAKRIKELDGDGLSHFITDD